MIGHGDEKEAGFTVRFTSIGPDVTTYLQAILAACLPSNTTLP